MNDQEYEETKQRVFAIARKWQRALGLTWWVIRYEWLRERIPTSEEDRAHGFVVVAQAYAHWKYGEAEIRVSLPAIKDQTDAEIERIMIHEFMHVLVDECRQTGDGWLDHEERVVTNLTRAILWVRDAMQVHDTDY